MKNPSRLLLKSGLASALLVGAFAGAFGCSADSSQEAADARDEAAKARADVVDANGRVKAADAHVKAAEADASVDALADRRSKTNDDAKSVIPSGTLLKVSLTDVIDSNTSSAGDLFWVSLAESVVVDGATLLSKGTRLQGRVINAEGAGKVKGRALVQLELTGIEQGNRIVAISTKTFEATADSTQGRDAGIIAGGAGVGAAIGAIAGGKKGAAIGAATGGGAGTGVVLATKGKEIHYGPETRLDFTLANAVKL